MKTIRTFSPNYRKTTLTEITVKCIQQNAGQTLVAVLLWNTLEGVNVSYLPCGVIPTEIDTAEDQMVHRHPQEREREGERGLLLNKTCRVVTAHHRMDQIGYTTEIETSGVLLSVNGH